jgi:hypothetical protein
LILTAGHCVLDKKAEELRVAFGAQPLSRESQENFSSRVNVLKKFKTSAVLAFKIHPDFGSAGDDADMALLKIEGQIPAGFSAAPLLTKAMSEIVQGAMPIQLIIAGYGVIDEDNFTPSEVLRKAEVFGVFEGRHILVDQRNGFGGCFGDSGGPAFLKIDQKLYLVGVTHGGKVEIIDGERIADCHHTGIWGDPNLEREFLNQAAETLGSKTRFEPLK